MSIPASIAISKIRMPELEEPVTRGRVVVDRGKDDKDPPVNALHAFAKGAVFGLVVAGQILCNVLTILSLVATINGLLTWIGRGFGIHQLTLQLVLRYIFYPITFLLGTRTYLSFSFPVRVRRLTLFWISFRSSRRSPFGNPARLGAPRDQTHRERVRGVRKPAGADGLAGRPLEAWLYDRVVRAVRLCQPRFAWHSDRRAVGARAVAHARHCPYRPQRDDRWFHLYVTSCRHSVRVVLAPSSCPAANMNVLMWSLVPSVAACSSDQ